MELGSRRPHLVLRDRVRIAQTASRALLRFFEGDFDTADFDTAGLSDRSDWAERVTVRVMSDSFDIAEISHPNPDPTLTLTG